MSILIKNPRIISTDSALPERADLLIEQGIISRILPPNSGQTAQYVLQADDLCLAPGLFDINAKACPPSADGQGEEDLISLSKAAIKGGYTAVCVNTAAQQPSHVEQVLEGGQYAACDIFPLSRISHGDALLSMAELKLSGAIAFYNDEGIEHPKLMRDAAFRAKKNDCLLMLRCKDSRLYGEGVIREGKMALLLDMISIPSSAESIDVARNIIFAAEVGVPIHIAHVSTAASVKIIASAKAAGVDVTCSTEALYLLLNSRELQGFNTLAKLDPPLGNPEDVLALCHGVRDGTIDCIASGHIPLKKSEKHKSLMTAPPGASTLETAFATALEALYHSGIMPLAQVVERMSLAPASILGRPYAVKEGAAADLILFDPDAPFTVTPDDFLSLGKNTPLGGKTLRGRVIHTIKGGIFMMQDQKVQ